jgi:cobalt-precorrin 5A hydrolase
MAGGEAMIVAGIGFRSGVGADEIVGLVMRALDAAALDRAALAGLATADDKAGEAGFCAAADRLAIRVLAVPRTALASAAPQCRTSSARSLRLFGVSSLAEAAALAGAGLPARLVLPRIASPKATCALAEGGAP